MMQQSQLPGTLSACSGRLLLQVTGPGNGSLKLSGELIAVEEGAQHGSNTGSLVSGDSLEGSTNALTSQSP